MALVQKSNPIRTTVMLVSLAAVVVAGLLYAFRDSIFPKSVNSNTTAGQIQVKDLPTYPTTGTEVLNTTAASQLTPHGPTTVTGTPGKTNPFLPIP